MGVYGFMGWITRNYKNHKVVIESLPDDVNADILYIDANGIIHPRCFKMIDHYPKWKKKGLKWLYNKMIAGILNYITYLAEYSKAKMVYICVDGVAPMAKMNQQRLRRFRSIDNLIENERLKKKHGKVVPDRWSNTVVTPGTEFMELLHKSIVDYVKKQKHIKFKYSSYHSHGEGEHKIIADIRKRVNTHPNDVYVIHGLDADLVFLSWASQKKNIYLLRETLKLGKFAKTNNTFEVEDPVVDVAEDLNYVSIDEMKRCYYKECCKLIKARKQSLGNDFNIDKIDKESIINDFIFICYFLGNDFLPHIPSIDISIGGMNIIIDAYVDAYVSLDEHIIKIEPKLKINMLFLQYFLKYLSNKENYYFSKILPDYMRKVKNRKCHFSDPYDIEKWEIENLMNIKVIDPIKLGVGNKKEWKYRYYNHHFKIDDVDSLRDNICYEYIRGLKWVITYYFHGCISWSWQFTYSHGPFISDLYYYIRNCITEGNDINDFKIVDEGYLSPCQQLLAVLPPECENILPESYKFLVKKSSSPIIDFYPVVVHIDRINMYKDYKCHPIIPIVDPYRIKDATNKLKLTKNETIRNSEQDVIENDFN